MQIEVKGGHATSQRDGGQGLQHHGVRELLCCVSSWLPQIFTIYTLLLNLVRNEGRRTKSDRKMFIRPRGQRDGMSELQTCGEVGGNGAKLTSPRGVWKRHGKMRWGRERGRRDTQVPPAHTKVSSFEF